MRAKGRTPKQKRVAPAKRPRAGKFVGARFPILEFDPARTAVIEPHVVHKPREVPEHCVLCFFQDVIDDVCKSARVVTPAGVKKAGIRFTNCISARAGSPSSILAWEHPWAQRSSNLSSRLGVASSSHVAARAS
jgi:hypothetical protein